jgi:hypothetical protein
VPEFEHALMADMRRRHADWVWNRSDTHVFLGLPRSHETFKTPVEPGNSFSPGPGTYGVSTWVWAEGKLYAPEEMPLADIRWRFEEGSRPVLISEWTAGPVEVRSELFCDGDLEVRDVRDYSRVELRNGSARPVECALYVVLRSFGAAGGPLRRMEMRDGTVWVNGAPSVYAEEPPTAFGAVSYATTGQDVSVYLKSGKLPDASSADDPSTWASGALEYRLSLPTGAARRFDFACHLHAGHWAFPWLRPLERPLRLDAARERAVERRRRGLTVALDVPDARFRDAFFCQLQHLLMFTVHDAPRISPVTYPLWWVRDCAYVVNALDMGGYDGFAAAACRDAVRHDVMTGFGAEGDVPGELIWMLSEHYLLTRDRGFLEEVHPFIEAKAELLIAMRHADRPMFAHQEFVTSECGLVPSVDLLCAPARDGLIVGKMDHHFPLFWVNGFAFLGLSRAAACAEALGRDGSRFSAEAEAVRRAMRGAFGTFGRNERDFTCAVWPTGWASREDPQLRSKFDDWWRAVRMPGGIYAPEKLWTYFEVGQAHNYLLLGSRERAWTTIERFLTNHHAPGLYTYHEGQRDENTALLLWQRTRGWDKAPCVTPHGWTAAELFLLLRDCLVREEGGALVVGSGVPASWMDRPFSVGGLPTHFGRASFSYEPEGRRLELTTARRPPLGVRAEFAVPVHVEVRPDPLDA